MNPVNTSNFVKNTLLYVIFSTLFLLFGYPDETLSLMFDISVKHLVLCNKLHSYSFNYSSVSDWLIHHNRLLLTKFGENFVILN